MQRLLIIDGNAMLHRAFHAIPLLNTPDGQPTNAVYGFATMLIRFVHDFQPSHVAVVFDRPAPTFRKKLYTDYQATRPKMDDQLVSQIVLVHDLVSSFHIPIYEQDGFEADDVIGTICETVSGIRDVQTIIVTGDRDILQLVVDEKVLVYLPTKGISEGKIYSSVDVVERLGVPPSHIIDWKGLAGDSSDHYPGVVGIGPKTAVDLINQFGTLESLYSALEKDTDTQSIKTAVKEKLLRQRDNAFLCKTLATIRRDAPIPFAIDTAKLTTLSTDEAIAFLERLKMGSIVKRLKAMSVITATAGKKDLPEKKTDDAEERVKDEAEQLSLV